MRARIALVALLLGALPAACSVPGTAIPAPSAPAQPGGLFNDGTATDRSSPSTSPAAPPSNLACDTITWADFPDAVTVPLPQPPGTVPHDLSIPAPQPVPGDPHGSCCRWDNSLVMTVHGVPEGKQLDDIDILSPGVIIDVHHPQYFFVHLTIANPAVVPIRPDRYEHGTLIDLAGIEAVQAASVSPDGVPQCLIALRPDGPRNVLVDATNSRFPAVDTCTLVRTLATTVAQHLA